MNGNQQLPAMNAGQRSFTSSSRRIAASRLLDGSSGSQLRNARAGRASLAQSFQPQQEQQSQQLPRDIGLGARKTLSKTGQWVSISIRHFTSRSALSQKTRHRGSEHDENDTHPERRQQEQQQRQRQQQQERMKTGKQSFRSKLGAALGKTKIEWYPIPISVGIGFLGVITFLKAKRAEEKRQEQERAFLLRDGEETVLAGQPRIRPSGPWHLQIMSLLPLKAISRAWGWFNELTIPYYLRGPSFRFYSWLFGVNISEAVEDDIRVYPNLGEFFYRQLRPGMRPLDPNPAAIVSPSDGTISQFGTITNGEVEQVKGVTYSLDALLGREVHPIPAQVVHPTQKPLHHDDIQAGQHADIHSADAEFAKVNGLTYTLPTLLSGSDDLPQKDAVIDASLPSESGSEAQVSADLARNSPYSSWFKESSSAAKNALYYVVIYLAPGDYHRFHSPVPWVVESRRHFAGELYSVSPYLQRNLPGLFTLNERIALLGRWRWGFFSLTPVGATNVGSIRINFDSELRTNSLLSDTAAGEAAASAARRGEEYHGFTEATYEHASETLKGHALQKGEEMGGFRLGSTVVLVFEAPGGDSDCAGWKWKIEKGQRVRMGEALGEVNQ